MPLCAIQACSFPSVCCRPQLALVDESTSAVGEELEAAMYRGAQGRGVTLVRYKRGGGMSNIESYSILSDFLNV